MQLNEVTGVPVVNDYVPPPEPERPRSDKEQKVVDEEAAKFHWRVNMLVDRTVVEAFANNGSVVLTSTSNHETSNYSDYMHKKDNDTHTLPGGSARPGTMEMWAINSAAEIAVTWWPIHSPGFFARARRVASGSSSE